MTLLQLSRLWAKVHTVSCLSNGIARDACTREELEQAQDDLVRYVKSLVRRAGRDRKEKT